MQLFKIKKVIEKEMSECSKEVLLVLDAETGQNAISQVKAFKETTDITGIVLTKLDGTAKGGVVVGIVDENKVPYENQIGALSLVKKIKVVLGGGSSIDLSIEFALSA